MSTSKDSIPAEINHPLEPGVERTVERTPSQSSGPTNDKTVRSIHSLTSSKSIILSQKLAAKLAHAKRIAEIESQNDRIQRAAAERAAAVAQRAAARERELANLALQSELAAIDAVASQNQSHGSHSSHSRVESWLDDNLKCNVPTKNLENVPNQEAHMFSLPQVPRDPCPTPVVLESNPPPAPIAGPSEFYPNHRQSLGNTHLGTCLSKGTQNKECTQNKDLLTLPTNSQSKNEIGILAQAIADIASSRKKVSKIRLPSFSGRVADWLPFRRVYDLTKHSYTVSENLARLNSSIHGAARDAVSSLLVAALDPDEIIATLELRFARPEFVILYEVAAVRALPRLSSDFGREINSFACRVLNCITTVKLLNHTEYLASPELCNVILSKFTPLLRTRWADFAYLQPKKHKLELISEFLIREAELQTKFCLLQNETVMSNRDCLRHDNVTCLRRDNVKNTERVHAINSNLSHRNSTISTKKSMTKNSSEGTRRCRFCLRDDHSVSECSEFSSLSLDGRLQWVIDNKVCRRCLKRGGHLYRSCSVSCKECGLKHNSLLHDSTRETTANIVSAPLPTSPSTSNPSQVRSSAQSFVEKDAMDVVAHSNLSCFQRPLLKIAAVTVSGPRGDFDTYALLDDGSTATLIDSTVAEKIGAHGPQSVIRVDCIGGLNKTSVVNFVEFKIKGRHSSETHVIKNARAISNLGISKQCLSRADLKQFNYLSDLTDVFCYGEIQPTILIGADNWQLTLTRSIRKGPPSGPVAVDTALGWVLYGFTTNKVARVHSIITNHTLLSESYSEPSSLSDLNLESLIKENYKLDSIGITQKDYRTRDEEHALGILNRTTRRLPSGRFETGLLWKPNISVIPSSYQLALFRFKSLERKFKKDAEYANSYRDNVNSTISKGYAELCTDTPQNISWYLPHFGVIHPHKRKLRVVHDAAATVEGVSLNSLLLPGPDLLQPLLAILMRFREGLVALSGDIRGMFPQVKIRPEDRDAQRFFWRNSSDEPIREYRMSSMMFGACSSPCTAIYIKNKNAEEQRNQFPQAVNSIVHDHYMDDFLGSVQTVSEAAKLAADIVNIHKAGGFEMRSWISNCKEALQSVPSKLHAAPATEVSLGPVKNNVRVLGVTWNLTTDSFSFLKDLSVSLPSNLTKRNALSQLMKVFDPLGFLTPIVIRGRIYFQQTWRLNISWDQKLPSDFIQKWSQWFEDLKLFSNASLSRCYINDAGFIECQLHTFADSSEHAYACVAYWRFLYPDGSVKLSLIGGKARLAPLKPASIPRLELQAALIACRFATYILEAHRFKPAKTVFWSDSLTVLKWLRSDARSFKTFVAVRVGEILETSNVSDWRFVPTAENVADDATRPDSKFENSSRWFNGPSFLTKPDKDWPLEPPSESLQTLEQKNDNSCCPESVALVKEQNLPDLSSPLVADHRRFSSWTRLVRATARVHKCLTKFRSILGNIRTKIQNPKIFFRNKGEKLSNLPELSALDLSFAELQLFIVSQQECFKPEITSLLNSTPFPKKSRLVGMKLTMKPEGSLNLLTRIGAAKNIPIAQELSPMILDGRHRIVQLLIRHYHVKFLHGYNEAVVNELRQRFHILRLRPAVRKIARSCFFCCKRKNKPYSPPIGDLPEARLEHSVRPFTNVGLDYFGPVTVTIGRRSEKRYVALFTCLVVRAVHLEVVHSLSTDSAIMAIRRFIARRGCPSKIFSDNGTAFVGASKKLKEVFDFSANLGITWTFIPPAAPFMGGSWERLVRSIKTALSTTLSGRSPKEEILLTLLLEAEAVVNSRPLTFVSVDIDGESALTPFSFLIGSSSNGPPIRQLRDEDLIGGKDVWKKGLRLADHFWSRWTKEYLPLLRRNTSKASGTSEHLPTVGSLVLVVDGSLPRASWPLGKITNIWPGKDGVVRVAEVLTKGGLLKRAIKMLVPVPISGQLP